MKVQITSGHAASDGTAFGGWFIGDLQRWLAADSHATASALPNLRQSRDVEIKWAEHRAGEERKQWAACSKQRTMSLLVRGKFLLRFRSPADRAQVIEHLLEREGDYVIWGADLEHTWRVEQDSVIFTVRWTEKE